MCRSLHDLRMGNRPDRRFAEAFKALHKDDHVAEEHWARECLRWMLNRETRKVPVNEREALAERVAMRILWEGIKVGLTACCVDNRKLH